jgi:hypothetical protein
MDDDFGSFLEDMERCTGKMISASGGRKTVIVHPTVWRNEKEAKKAAKDWKYRERIAAERELERVMRGV